MTATYPDTIHLGEHPMLGDIEPLEVLLRTASLKKCVRVCEREREKEIVCERV